MDRKIDNEHSVHLCVTQGEMIFMCVFNIKRKISFSIITIINHTIMRLMYLLNCGADKHIYIYIYTRMRLWCHHGAKHNFYTAHIHMYTHCWHTCVSRIVVVVIILILYYSIYIYIYIIIHYNIYMYIN